MAKIWIISLIVIPLIVSIIGLVLLILINVLKCSKKVKLILIGIDVFMSLGILVYYIILGWGTIISIIAIAYAVIEYGLVALSVLLKRPTQEEIEYGEKIDILTLIKTLTYIGAYVFFIISLIPTLTDLYLIVFNITITAM